MNEKPKCIDCGEECSGAQKFKTEIDTMTHTQVTIGPRCVSCWDKLPASERSFRVHLGEATHEIKPVSEP